MAQKSGGIREWVIPFAFVLCAGWVIWHGPAYILDFFPHENESMTAQITELHERKDVSPGLPGLFGGTMDIIDWTALLLLPVILIISMTLVMLYEVFLRYVVEAPTLWANELTLWIAGFVFLVSGLYAMQQRCHIRIFILYDILPRPLRKACDVISVVLLCAFAFFLVFGSYNQVFGIKFHRWEMFGTAFDPPIPATIQPAIIIVICLVALQAVMNLIADWDQNPGDLHDDLVDEEELEAIKKSVGPN